MLINIEINIEMVNTGNYAIGKYLVTQAQWKMVMGNNPSYFEGDNLPVEQVSWYDVQDFLEKLNQRTGKRYRLPTEAEWEYAARGGSNNRGYEYAGSNNIGEVAWYDENSGNQTHAVGLKQPNELGIYDMSGNVLEWCSDGDVFFESEFRVIRGGCWFSDPEDSRVDYQDSANPYERNGAIGFRLALSL